ncbi:MAG TPA: TetR/AcrR family transcriptional regulator [Solirubrobacterales bacterium]|nr:TetR/AcrR family transcriptional regulator [Solirubrobacterales bacterium]
MTDLRLVEPDAVDGPSPTDGPFAAGTPLPRRLPPGRHGIPLQIVAEHQRLRLLGAMAEALGEHGYANVTTTHVSELANVSTSTFYKHFGNLWDCLLAAYVAAADRLCVTIEASCAQVGPDGPDADPLLTGIEAGLALFAAEPELARLLSAQAPREATALAAARRLLTSRLAAMLRRARGGKDDAPQPAGLDERLIDASLAFVGRRIATGDAASLPELAPELAAILDRPRQKAA